MWFAEFGANNVGRLTLSGRINVAAGPDGNVWFTETGGGFWDFAGKIGYVTTDGSLIRDFPSTKYLTAHVHDLAFDSKGILWYTKFAFTFSALDKLVY